VSSLVVVAENFGDVLYSTISWPSRRVPQPAAGAILLLNSDPCWCLRCCSGDSHLELVGQDDTYSPVIVGSWHEETRHGKPVIQLQLCHIYTAICQPHQGAGGDTSGRSSYSPVLRPWSRPNDAQEEQGLEEQTADALTQI